MLKSIRSILHFCFIIVGISLFLVLVLGIRQFQLTGQYNEITALSERTIFAFSTIREQVTESLITRNYIKLKGVIGEIELLNNNISRLYDSTLIPGQYKLAMADKVDLTGLVIALRKIDSEQNTETASLDLQQELRLIAKSLITVDRIITGQIRDSVVGFQMSIIGAMGILISSASFFLIILYRRAVRPLLDLSKQAEDFSIEETGFNCRREAGTEIVQLASSVNALLERLPQETNDDDLHHDAGLLSATINETTNALNGIINYAQLLLESEDDGLFSEEQQHMLKKIINDGERVAGQWQKLNSRFTR